MREASDRLSGKYVLEPALTVGGMCAFHLERGTRRPLESTGEAIVR